MRVRFIRCRATDSTAAQPGLTVENLFEKDIFRPINGVVKADQLDEEQSVQAKVVGAAQGVVYQFNKRRSGARMISSTI